MARLLATFQRHKERIGEIRKRVLTLEFGGAAGTLATLDSNVALKCQAELARELQLAQPEIAWHTERDRIAEVGAFLGILCGTLSKNATDIKLMMQTEIGEVSEPYLPHRGSSSIMPNKVNPYKSLMVGLQVHPKNMRRNLNLTKGLIVSEAVMMGLGAKTGRQTAHDLVYEYCRRAALEDHGICECIRMIEINSN
ncbi:hypothetical protein I4U23_012316 [Adineta vaga]|nr:hypothetical protein I4U23_012316 [Adineta vaga]